MAPPAGEIEKIYQKKSQLEHILLRPDTYIGSVEMLEQEMWIWDQENQKMLKKEIKFVPGLYKIFDEILVNASDNKQRDKNMSLIRINIDKEKNSIRIYNNGRGIPVVEHKEEKVLVPTLIFGHLLTSSNYNDDEKKVTGGRNGYGAKLCNIFSKKFVLETSSREYKKCFKQVWTDNMSKAQDPIVTEAKDDDFTCITFVPDLKKFKMDHLDDDTIALMARRAYDIAASTPNIKVYLNDKRLPINKFEDYCKLYLTSSVDENALEENSGPPKLIYEKVNDRWEVAVACSDIGFQQVSFVNSIATTKGGRHIDYINDQLIKHLSELVNKKNKNGNQVKPFQIKNHMWVFVNCLIENPTFDSQTKENMTLQSKSFGSKCVLSEEFYKRVTKSGILDRVLTWLAFKEKTDLEKAGSKSKVSKLRNIPKLDDANNAGTKDSASCTLIVTEGDSAKTLAVAGLGIVGRDQYGVFPLRGKMLNVREASTKQILENSEISNLLKIIGLNFKEKYESRDSLKQLRYGKLMIMTDQDHDGSHIKGLIINFIHYQWPNLLKHGFVEEFITPIVKVSKGKEEKAFYSMPEFEEWQQKTENWPTWKIKYYKGLGTSTSKEAKEYFSDMKRHRIKFNYVSARDDLAIQLAFSKKFIDERKDWLSRYMEERKIRRETHSVDQYLYQKDTTGITYTDFVNKELVLFSNLDNERSIPSVVDGFKPGQRKVLFSCFKRNLVRELKVAQLAGSVAELSAYHHGEMSLMSTIINLAQNFVGSNNINLLQPIGQFGTRLHGGKDAASPRYIFTCLSPLTRLLFNPKDDPLYTYINDDGLRVEPEWYCPILPTVLVNGAEGIGTGWSTKLPNYNPREIITNLKLMINGQEPKPMMPFYKNFRGKIIQVDDIRIATNGELAILDENDVEITELPIGVWTQYYKENVLEPFLHGQDKVQPCITDYKEYHTDTTVRFVVKMTPEQFKKAEAAGLHKFFRIQKTLSLNSIVLFDHTGCLKRYESVLDILKEFYIVRAELYQKRKDYMEGMLKAESLKLDNIARFILEKIEGKIRVENKKKADIVTMLRERNYDPDPVAKWKKKILKEQGLEDQDTPIGNQGEEEVEQETESTDKHDYDYILSMPIWNLTMEKKDEILRQQKNKGDELQALRAKTHLQLWLDDLEQFSEELDKFEKAEKEGDSAAQMKAFKASAASAAKGSSVFKKRGDGKPNKLEYMPSTDGQLVEPVLDPALLAKGGKKETKETPSEVKKELSIVDIITNGAKEARQMSEEDILLFMKNLGKPVKREPKESTAKEKKPREPKTTTSKPKKEPSDPSEVIDLSDSETSKASKIVSTKTKSTAKTADKNNSIKNYFTKKSKKAADTSDDADSDGLMSDDSFSVSEPVEPRERVARQRKEVNYEKMMFVDDEDDDDALTSKSASKNKKKIDSNESDNDDDDFGEKNKQTAAKADKKSQAKRAFNDSSSIEEVIESDDSVAPKKSATTKKVLATSSKQNAADEQTTKSKSEAKKKTTTTTKKTTSQTSLFKAKTAITIDSDSESENIKTTKSKPAASKKPKYNFDGSDNDSFVVEDSDEDFVVKSKPKATAGKKKLLPATNDIFKKAAMGSKKSKNIESDDEYLVS